MTPYQTQFRQCWIDGTAKKVQEKWADNLNKIPPFLPKLAAELAENPDATFTRYECGKFGGTCSSRTCRDGFVGGM